MKNKQLYAAITAVACFAGSVALVENQPIISLLLITAMATIAKIGGLGEYDDER